MAEKSGLLNRVDQSGLRKSSSVSRISGTGSPIKTNGFGGKGDPNRSSGRSSKDGQKSSSRGRSGSTGNLGRGSATSDRPKPVEVGVPLGPPRDPDKVGELSKTSKALSRSKENLSKSPSADLKREKSMEEILTEALKLTEDEKANMIATRENSLASKLAKTKEEELRANNIKSTSNEVKNSPRSPEARIASSEQPKESNKSVSGDGDGRFKESLYSSPVNYAKSRFAAAKDSVSSSGNNGPSLSERIPRQSIVSEAKQIWEKKAMNSGSNDGSGLVNGTKAVGIDGPIGSVRSNPVRPFLAKGSVAERVLLFERRPEMKKEFKIFDSSQSVIKTKSPVLYNTWKNQDKSQSDVLQIARSFNQSPSHRRTSSYPNRSSWGTGYGIPRFYFPTGRPYSSSEIDAKIRRIVEEFQKLPERKASREHFGRITKAADLPLYWKQPLFEAVIGDVRKLTVTCDQFVKYFKDLVSTCHDDASKFVRIFSHGKRHYLLPEDFVPMMQDVIETHPGLGFLKEATEFHSRYVHTVIARIFYCVNKSWSGRITIPEIRKSNFLLVVSLLEEEDDINQITDYFSYEHFYVIYCKFWELDKDHDLIIDKEDLMRHNDAAISSRMIDRIFSGAVTRGPVRKQGKMTYSEFVWFLISEEDKRHPRSIEYWFRCMDIDGDGYLSMYELEFFYEEQVKRMEALGIEALPFNDCLCQMLDMVRPKEAGRIALADLKRCRMTPVFFDTFFNLDKYLDHEQRDPFASKDGEDNLITDWDRFAAEEYELLVAEESAQQARAN